MLVCTFQIFFGPASNLSFNKWKIKPCSFIVFYWFHYLYKRAVQIKLLVYYSLLVFWDFRVGLSPTTAINPNSYNQFKQCSKIYIQISILEMTQASREVCKLIFASENFAQVFGCKIYVKWYVPKMYVLKVAFAQCCGYTLPFNRS